MVCFDFCFSKAAEAIRSVQLQNDRLTFPFIGYVDLMIFREIWSEHSPIDKEQQQRVSANSFILNTFQ